MTRGNDAKFHLFVSFSLLVLMGPGKFKNRAFLMEKRAEGKEKERESVQRREDSSVVGECNLRLARLLFFSPSPADEA